MKGHGQEYKLCGSTKAEEAGRRRRVSAAERAASGFTIEAGQPPRRACAQHRRGVATAWEHGAASRRRQRFSADGAMPGRSRAAPSPGQAAPHRGGSVVLVVLPLQQRCSRGGARSATSDALRRPAARLLTHVAARQRPGCHCGSRHSRHTHAAARLGMSAAQYTAVPLTLHVGVADVILAHNRLEGGLVRLNGAHRGMLVMLRLRDARSQPPAALSAVGRWGGLPRKPHGEHN